MDKTDKEDRLVAEIMRDFEMESPPSGFTDRVMQRIQAESHAHESRPLISRAGWIGIAAGFCLLLGLIFLEYDSQAPADAGWLAQYLPSLGFPAVDFSLENLLSWINAGNSTLLWIFTGIGGLFLLAFFQRLFENWHFRNLYTL